MKARYHTLLLLLLPAILFSACDVLGGDDDDNGAPSAAGVMRAEIDGTAWSAPSAQATRVSMMGVTMINVVGANTAGETMTITLNGVNATGAYAFSSDEADAQWVPDGAGSFYNATGGSVTITTLNDDRVAGTFAFEANRSGATVSVTEGEFEARFAAAVGL